MATQRCRNPDLVQELREHEQRRLSEQPTLLIGFRLPDLYELREELSWLLLRPDVRCDESRIERIARLRKRVATRIARAE